MKFEHSDFAITEVSLDGFLRGHSSLSWLKDPTVRFKKNYLNQWIACFKRGVLRQFWARNHQRTLGVNTIKVLVSTLRMEQWPSPNLWGNIHALQWYLVRPSAWRIQKMSFLDGIFRQELFYEVPSQKEEYINIKHIEATNAEYKQNIEFNGL